MKKLLLLATATTAYYLLKSKQKKKNKQPVREETTPVKTVTPQKADMNVDNPKTPLLNDVFPLSGEYRWTFYLGPIQQISTHIFSEDHIDYRMRGKAHSTDYRLQKLSYDGEHHKWIGKTDDDLVYVLFFKTDDSDSDSDKDNDKQITTYKHKCGYGDEGIAEAIAFAYPADDATADHGWNVYSREDTNEPQDILPFSGEFLADISETSSDESKNDPTKKISIADSQVTWAGKTYQKLTHHTGERRWVGQYDDEFLVMFYELTKQNTEDQSENKPVDISLSLQTYDDGEVAYQSKHSEQQYANFKSVD